MNKVLFETERLYVRHFNPHDLDDFAALCADPDVLCYVGDGTTLSRDEVVRWIEVCQQKYADRGYGTSAVFTKRPAQFIGYCGVVRAAGNNFDEIIYVFHQAAWGKGYATEVVPAMVDYVFAHSMLDRIYATIHAENSPSLHVIQKLGFHFEKQIVDDDGTPVDFYFTERM